METRDYWFYTAGLAVIVALVTLAGCGRPHAQHDFLFVAPAEARAAAGDTVQGTVRSVLAAPEPEEPWERTHLSYEDPLAAYLFMTQAARVRLGNKVDPKYTLGASVEKK